MISPSFEDDVTGYFFWSAANHHFEVCLAAYPVAYFVCVIGFATNKAVVLKLNGVQRIVTVPAVPLVFIV